MPESTNRPPNDSKERQNVIKEMLSRMPQETQNSFENFFRPLKREEKKLILDVIKSDPEGATLEKLQTAVEEFRANKERFIHAIRTRRITEAINASDLLGAGLSPSELDETRFEIIDALLSKLQFGLFDDALRIKNKLGGNIVFKEVKGYYEAVKSGFIKNINEGSYRTARRLYNEFGSELDLNHDADIINAIKEVWEKDRKNTDRSNFRNLLHEFRSLFDFSGFGNYDDEMWKELVSGPEFEIELNLPDSAIRAIKQPRKASSTGAEQLLGIPAPQDVVIDGYADAKVIDGAHVTDLEGKVEMPDEIKHIWDRYCKDADYGESEEFDNDIKKLFHTALLMGRVDVVRKLYENLSGLDFSLGIMQVYLEDLRQGRVNRALAIKMRFDDDKFAFKNIDSEVLARAVRDGYMKAKKESLNPNNPRRAIIEADVQKIRHEFRGAGIDFDELDRVLTVVPPPIPTDTEGDKRELRPPTGPVQHIATDDENEQGLSDNTVDLQPGDLEDFHTDPNLKRPEAIMPPEPIDGSVDVDVADQSGPIHRVNTADLEPVPMPPPIPGEEPYIEPAESPGPEDAFIMLLDSRNVHDAYDVWSESEGELDAILFDKFNTDTIRAFFRMGIERQHFDDAKRLFIKKSGEIDFRPDISTVFYTFYFGNQEAELDNLKIELGDIFDFTILTANEVLPKLRDELKRSREQIAQLIEENSELDSANKELSDGAKRVSEELATANDAYAKANARAVQTQFFVEEKESKINQLSMELVGSRQGLETALARMAELQSLYDGEVRINQANALTRQTYEGSLSTEVERRRGAEKRVSELDGQLRSELAKNQEFSDRLEAEKNASERTIAELKESLRISEQQIGEHKTDARNAKSDNAALREILARYEREALELRSKLRELDDIRHALEQLQGRLAEMELANGKSRSDLFETKDSASQERDSLQEQLRKVREDNDRLHQTNLALTRDMGDLRADNTRFSGMEQLLGESRQRIATLESNLDEERQLNAQLRQQFINVSQSQVSSGQTIRAGVDATAGDNAVINEFYELLIKGDLKRALQLRKKRGKSLNLQQYILQAYNYCVDNNLIDTATQIRLKFKGEVDL